MSLQVYGEIDGRMLKRAEMLLKVRRKQDWPMVLYALQEQQVPVANAKNGMIYIDVERPWQKVIVEMLERTLFAEGIVERENVEIWMRAKRKNNY